MSPLPIRAALLALAGALLPCGAAARSVVPGAPPPRRPFPMIALVRGSQEVLLEAIPHEVAALAALEEVVLEGVPSPGGAAVRLALQRVHLHIRPGAVHIDGAPAPPGQGRRAALSLWSGRVLGRPGSQAYLALGVAGIRGWYGEDGALVHILAQPGPGGSWATPRARFVTEEWLARFGGGRELSCAVRSVPGALPALPAPRSAGGRLESGGPPLPFYRAELAYETDWELFVNFGSNLAAEQSYIHALIGAVAARYREQIGVLFDVVYLGFHTANTDPWTSGDCMGRLNEFRAAWRNGGAPQSAHAYQMLSGVAVQGCGGVSWLAALCNQSYGFSLAAYMTLFGQASFPIAQGPLTWDFMVSAHEMGHTFSAIHTHEYTPPIDQCALGDCSVTPHGTNMSYCHLCPGRMKNITTYFHPQVAADMRQHVVNNSCLSVFRGVLSEDLGHALAGSNGTPELEARLSENPDVLHLDASSAPLSSSGLLVLGAAPAMIPLLGGTLVPAPQILVPVASDGAGAAAAALPVPLRIRLGAVFWAQIWFADLAGPRPALAATNGLRCELFTP